MKLSEHFELGDMCFSQTAVRKGIDNTVTPEALFALETLCKKVLEPLVTKGMSFSINSGFRCVELNKAIGGAANSQHCKGEAADLRPKGISVEQFYQEIIKSGVPFDQIIQEFDSWVHVSYKAEPRGQKLRAHKKDGVTVYIPDGVQYK